MKKRNNKDMSMNKLDVWAMNSPFREFVLKGKVLKHFKDYFQQLKGKIVLEIGCGNGSGAKVIKKYFSPKKIIAIDLDPRMVSLAKRNVCDKSIIIEQGDATKLKYQDSQFEAIFDFITIHHIPSPQWKECLRELLRVLKPKGKLFIYEASIESFKTPIGRILKIFTFHPYNSMYTREGFLRCLKSLNLKILKEVLLPRHFVIVAEK